MRKAYALGAIFFVLGLIITVVTWLLTFIGWYSVSKGLVLVWGLFAITAFFESALDFTNKYLKVKKENKQ